MKYTFDDLDNYVPVFDWNTEGVLVVTFNKKEMGKEERISAPRIKIK
tara:strand:+ start:627 stop:767 length:141 start_codon:yes stop_codon:yes gene_type:complete